MDGVDPGDPSDGLGGVGPVTGDQDGSGDTRLPQGPDHAWGIGSYRVFEQECPGGDPVHGREDGQGAVEGGAATDLPQPRRLRSGDDPGSLAEPYRPAGRPATVPSTP